MAWQILEEKAAAAAKTVVLPSAEHQNNDTEVSAQARLSFSRMVTGGSQHSVGTCESECDRSHVDSLSFLTQYDARNVCTKEINVRVTGQGTSQCLNDVSRDLCLPKFTDPDKQNIDYTLITNLMH